MVDQLPPVRPATPPLRPASVLLRLAGIGGVVAVILGGFYYVNGTLDAPTREAVRRYQEPLGLDSPELSLAAAQSLGIIAVPLK